MQKVKCKKCGYLNAQDELVCGMCGEVFKKEKAGLGGKKIVEEVVPAKEKKPAKGTRTKKAVKAKSTRKKAREKPGAVPEIISLPEEPTAEPATEPVPELVAETEPVEEVAVEEQAVEMVEQPAAASVETTMRNFLQTEQFRQAVKLIAREIVPAKQAGPSGLGPDELKSMVEGKIDQALPDFLQSEAVLSVVRQAVSEMPAPEGEVPTPVVSDEELEKKIGEVLAKSAGRNGGSSLTMEAVELKMNAMLTGIREKVSRLSEDEPPPSLTDVKKIIENQVQLALGEKSAQGDGGMTEERVTTLVEEKLSQVSPAEEGIEERVMSQVRQFLEEQGARELSRAPVDEEKIASLIESKIAEVQLPTAAGTAADTAAIAQEVNSVLEKKFDSTEFALLMMDIVREAVGQTAPAGGESAAGISDEVLALRVGELLPEIIKGEQFHQAISAAIEELATQPQLTARDVERIANTRFEMLKSDLVSSESFTKKVTQAVEAVASKMAGAATPEDVETKLSESMDSLRAELEKLIAAKLTEQLDSEELTGRLRTLAAEEASKAAPEVPAPDMSEIDDKLASLREEVASKTAESLEEIQGRIAEMPGTIDEKVSAYWQEKLSSEEIVDKISGVARQIAEGTLEARPALTTEDISNAWDEKFDSEEALNKIRDVAGQIAMSAMASQPALEPSEVDDKLAQLREEVEKTIAESLEEIQGRIAEMPGTIDEKVSAYWQEKLSSEEIVDKISGVARQIAEGTLEARPALTKDDISKAWDDKFDSEETLAKIHEMARQIAEGILEARPALTTEDVSNTWDEKFDSEETLNKIRDLAGQIAMSAIAAQPAPDMSEIDDKLASLREEVASKTAESLEEIQGRIAEMPGTIDEKVSAYWQEKLSSEEIVDKISGVARQIAEGTLEARPALTKDDISNAWDDKFDSEETLAKIHEMARQIAEGILEARPALTTEDVSKAWDEKFDSEEALNKIRDLAGQITMSAIAAQPALSPAEIDEKLAKLREEVASKTADSLDLIEDRVAEMPEVVDRKLDAHWQEKLSSEEIASKIRDIAAETTEEEVSKHPSLSPEEIESKIAQAVQNSTQELLSSEELTRKVEQLAGTISENSLESQMPKLIKNISSLITGSIKRALKEHLQSEDFNQAVGKLSEGSAEEALAAQPRLTPDDVREIAGGSFDHWIETYFKSEDFKEKVTEHTRNVAVELLRDARTVILEDAEMRTGEQIQASISALEYVNPATLSEKIESLQTSLTDKFSALEEKLTATAEETVSSRSAEFDSKIQQAVSEIDDKLKEVAAAFEQDIRPFKEQLEELGGDMNDKLAPLYEQFKELSMRVEKDLPALEKEVGDFIKNAAASAVATNQRLKSLADQVSTNMEKLAKNVEQLSGDFKTAKSELGKATTQKLAAYDKMIEGMAARVASIPPVDPDSIERMITAKVGDLPRQVEVYQKRLAALAEESLSRGPGGGISEAQVAKMIEEKLASGGGGALGLDEVAALVVTQLDMYMADLFTSDKFKKAIHENVTVGVEGGIDKEQFEQALRAFVQLEIKRVSDTTREMISGLLESDTFAQKVHSLAPAGAAGEGAAPALDADAILEFVKKALDTKEMNLKIAQKFLEVMTYVKSEVPKLVQAAIKKQT